MKRKRLSCIAAMLLALGVEASAWALVTPTPEEPFPDVRRLTRDVASAMTLLDAHLNEISEETWMHLIGDNRELIDPTTGQQFRSAHLHYPLVHYVFGPNRTCNSPEPITVLFLGGFHTDEVAPLHSSFMGLSQMMNDPTVLPPNTRVVYAPIVNPDGLTENLRRRYGDLEDAVRRGVRLPIERCVPQHGHRAGEHQDVNNCGSEVGKVIGRSLAPTRVSGANVDLNRDFRSSNPQSETRFVKALIDQYHPKYIISLHGPFGWLDYDGPQDAASRAEAARWMQGIQAQGGSGLKQHGYETKRGSLGDYGSSRGIHVLTIELPSAGGGHGIAAQQWQQYGRTIFAAIHAPTE